MVEYIMRFDENGDWLSGQTKVGQVVRCKDCANHYEYNEELYCKRLRDTYATDYDMCVGEYDYCSWGIKS